MLTESEFNILYYLLNNNGKTFSQRDISYAVNMSLGKTNKLIKELSEKQLLLYDSQNYKLTNNGKKALKPYKVDNAVIMAAGMSKRFAPLSYENPKGLLVVKGEVLIEREIEQLIKAGIDDIYVVVGYMKEKFFYLEDKYNIKIVINNDYYKYNNTSTLMCVLDKLSNTYICSSDNYFSENVFEKYVYKSYYSAVYSPEHTEEYCLKFGPDGKIKDVNIGGENSWYMSGHVYFDKSFSEKFVNILSAEYNNPITREQLWENLYMRYINELDLYIKKYDSDIIHEFDSLEELRLFDVLYINNADSDILRCISEVLNCSISEIKDIKAINEGLTNTSFKFIVRNNEYVYRHPGRGTSNYINRKSEYFSMQKACELGLDSTYIIMDKDKGWKISKYIKNARTLNYNRKKDVYKAIGLIKKLHDAKIISPYDFNIWNKILEFVVLLRKENILDFENFDNLYCRMEEVNKTISNDIYSKKCLCHNDCYSPNFIFDEEDNIYLIDWEYSGNDDPASDIGTFICCSDYTYDEALEIIKKYLGYEPENMELVHYLGYISIASYYWYVWALYQEYRGNPVGEWLYKWYKSCIFYEKKLKELC